MGLGLACALFVSRVHGFSNAGYYFFFVAVQQVFGYASSLGTSTYAIRALRRTPRSRLVVTVLWFHLVVVTAATFLVVSGVSILFGRLPADWLLVVALCMFGLIRQYSEDVFIGLGRYLEGSAIAVFENAARVVSIFFLNFEDRADVLIALCFSTFLAVVPGGFLLLRNGFRGASKRVPRRYLVYFYRRSFIAFISSFAGLLQTRLAVVISPTFLNPGEVGLFSTLLTVSEIPLRVGSAFTKFVYSDSSERSSNMAAARAYTLIRVALFLGIAASAALLSVYHLISERFYDDAFNGHIGSFVWLCCYSLLFLYANLVGNLLYGRGEAGNVLKASIAGVVVASVGYVFAFHSHSVYLLCTSIAAGAAVSAFLTRGFAMRSSHCG